MSRGTTPLGRRLLFAALPAILLLLVAEALARTFAAGQDARIHREHENLITVLGLPGLNEAMEFDPDRFWRLRDGLRDLQVVGSVREQPFDFRVSTHDGLRSPPFPKRKQRFRVLALGDSCTFGLGVDDEETWPARLQEQLDAEGLPVRVVNAGVPGYSAFQGLRFLQRRGRELAPDLIVATFGFNDRDRWSSRSDLETAEELRLSGWERLALQSRLVVVLRRWLRPGTQDTARDTGAQGDETPGLADKPRLAPREFYDTLRSIERESAAIGARLVLMNWPYRSQIDQGIREPLRYQVLNAQFARDAQLPLVDLPAAFVDTGGSLFLDHVHANPRGLRLVAEAVRPWVRPVATD